MSNQNNKNSINHNHKPFDCNLTSSQIEFLESANLMEEIDNCSSVEEVLDILALAKKELQDQIFDNIHRREILNPYKMTMVDPAALQKSLGTMVKNGCETAIIEVSSQGLEQNRHWGLGKFVIASFLNLYPEHIESHGSFENYKQAKMKLFQNLHKNGIAIGNGNDQYCNEMLQIAPTTAPKHIVTAGVDYQVLPYSHTMFKSFWVKDSSSNYPNNLNKLENHSFFVADFEVENSVLAGNITDKYLQKYHSRHFDYKVLFQNYYPIPGRMEWVVQNNKVVFEG